MPSASVAIEIHATSEDVFDLIHDYSRRLEWDPFLRDARLLGDAKFADIGVTSRCTARYLAGGLAMDTSYVSFSRPKVAAVAMIRGPIFLRMFAASIRQDRIDDETVLVAYRYNFKAQPRFLAPVLEPIVEWIFHRETSRRLSALKRFVENEQSKLNS